MNQPQIRGRPAGAEEAVCQAAVPAPPPAPGADAAEVGELAQELAAAFGGTVAAYREHFKLSVQEAIDRTSNNPLGCLDDALSGPPDQVTWFQLHGLAEHDPEKALRRWEEVKQAARDEIRSGHRAARTLEAFDGSCWERAQFLALRAELSQAWRPRDPLEQQLIDQLAQFRVLMERWQQTLTAYTALAAQGWKPSRRGGHGCELPRVSDVEAIDRAAALVERFHRLSLRTLKALQDQRRLRSRGAARRAGQVNVAQNQINIFRGGESHGG
jgi:hypothetical protein